MLWNRNINNNSSSLKNWSERELGSCPIRSPFASQTGFFAFSGNALAGLNYGGAVFGILPGMPAKIFDMEQENENKRTVKYSVETDAKLQRLADLAGCTKRDFFIQMVEYFYRTKKDPKDINDELLKKTLFRNHDTYIRFIKAQEDKLLIPLKIEMDRMVASQIKIIDSFNNQVLKANREMIAGQGSLGAQMDKAIDLISTSQVTKENLKQKFSYILGHFYKAGLNASAREKEALLQDALMHISKL